MEFFRRRAWWRVKGRSGRTRFFSGKLQARLRWTFGLQKQKLASRGKTHGVLKCLKPPSCLLEIRKKVLSRGPKTCQLQHVECPSVAGRHHDGPVWWISLHLLRCSTRCSVRWLPRGPSRELIVPPNLDQVVSGWWFYFLRFLSDDSNWLIFSYIYIYVYFFQKGFKAPASDRLRILDGLFVCCRPYFQFARCHDSHVHWDK